MPCRRCLGVEQASLRTTSTVVSAGNAPLGYLYALPCSTPPLQAAQYALLLLLLRRQCLPVCCLNLSGVLPSQCGAHHLFPPQLQPVRGCCWIASMLALNLSIVLLLLHMERASLCTCLHHPCSYDLAAAGSASMFALINRGAVIAANGKPQCAPVCSAQAASICQPVAAAGIWQHVGPDLYVLLSPVHLAPALGASVCTC